MIDINAILSTAFEQALRPLRQEIALQQSQLRAQHEKIETLEARLQGTQEHLATQVDVLSRSITTLDNGFGILHSRIEGLFGTVKTVSDRVEASAAFIVNEEDLNKAIDKGIERHLEQFNHDSYDDHLGQDTHAIDSEEFKDLLIKTLLSVQLHLNIKP